MGCGIDRPSVTVSRWITVSVRETQKREEEERRGERGGGGDRGIKPSPPPREPLPVFLSETGPYPGRKDLIPNAPPPTPPIYHLLLSFLVVLLQPLPRSLSLLLRDSSVSAVRLYVPPGNLPKRLICTT